MNDEPAGDTPGVSDQAQKIRLDKWLWHARFFKTRGLAAGIVKSGHVRVNGNRAGKPAQMVVAGDVLTFVQGDRVRVIRIAAPGARRGPAAEAQTLYDDLAPAEEAVEKKPHAATPKFDGKGRPTKRDRRKLDQSRAGTLD